MDYCLKMYSCLLFVVICQVVAANNIKLTCLKSENRPKAEKQLSACHRFNSLSCCGQAVTKGIAKNTQKIGNFSWALCGKKLSPQCNKYMRRLECFYQCSPYISQWKHSLRYGGVERVPICNAFCDSFFHACKDDLTCVRNWLCDFKIGAGLQNICPTDSTCKPFSEVYRDGEDMCHSMWGDSLQYMKSEMDCFDVDFEGINPNFRVHKKTSGKDNIRKKNSYFEKIFHALGVEEK